MSCVGLLRSFIWKYNRAAGWCVAAAWLVSILVGLKWLVDFDLTPGASGSPPVKCPAALERTTHDSRPLLVMFVHSHCPCSRVSIDELQQIVEARPGSASVRIYFCTPDVAADDWRETSLAKAAAEIPGVTLMADPRGEIAARFGIKTSGHLLVYGIGGEVLFSGGISAARGHRGDNPGRTAVLALLAGQSTIDAQHPVFGCPLFNPASPSTTHPTCPVQK